MQQSTWFTPEGLEDLLPPQAQKLESYRRQLIDGFDSAGFDLVLPPLAEFTDSLLTGTAGHMAVDTCRFTDQESGRMMGVRADMTPQVARIVSNRLKASDAISRLCYVGEVLKTRNNKAKGSRSPIQVGAEIYGHEGVESDLEIIELVLDSMQNLGLKDVKLSLGHIAVVNELMQLAELSSAQQNQMINILERKAVPEYEAFVAELDCDANLKDKFQILTNLCGEAEDVLVDVKAELNGLSEQLDAAIADIEKIIQTLSVTQAQVPMHLDVTDMRGYQYHTGVIFACYSSGVLQPIARGGRYDNIGAAFGLSLPATGFSLDLRSALDLLPDLQDEYSATVYCGVDADPSLKQAIETYKAEGYRVVKCYDLNGLQSGAQKIVKKAEQWTIETV